MRTKQTFLAYWSARSRIMRLPRYCWYGAVALYYLGLVTGCGNGPIVPCSVAQLQNMLIVMAVVAIIGYIDYRRGARL